MKAFKRMQSSPHMLRGERETAMALKYCVGLIDVVVVALGNMR